MENNLKTELKDTFTTYWHFLAIQKACQFHLFDAIDSYTYTLQTLSSQTKLAQKPLSHLLLFLVEGQYLTQENDIFYLTAKGSLLTEKHPESLKNACILWGQEHLTAWQNLDFTLQTGKPSFEHIYQKEFFDYLNDDAKKLKNYHLAMRDYATDDYKKLPSLCDFSKHDSIADVGGGLGILIGYIAKAFPQTKCILFDLPSVTALIENPEEQAFKIVSNSFFEPLSFQVDAIILSRVLHDWNDEKALQILQQVRNALNENGTLYVLEILQDEVQAHLLSLNMLTICQSYERTFKEYKSLLQQAGFSIQSRKQLNDLQTILICQ